MGMFDMFVHKCPRCDHDVEWQSKAGDCTLATFTESNCPLEVAADLDKKSAVCRGCGKVLSIQTMLVTVIVDRGG